jgi:hypothetical protein
MSKFWKKICALSCDIEGVCINASDFVFRETTDDLASDPVLEDAYALKMLQILLQCCRFAHTMVTSDPYNAFFFSRKRKGPLRFISLKRKSLGYILLGGKTQENARKDQCTSQVAMHSFWRPTKIFLCIFIYVNTYEACLWLIPDL